MRGAAAAVGVDGAAEVLGALGADGAAVVLGAIGAVGSVAVAAAGWVATGSAGTARISRKSYVSSSEAVVVAAKGNMFSSKTTCREMMTRREARSMQR
mgnify:CR=1 FL=1